MVYAKSFTVDLSQDSDDFELIENYVLGASGLIYAFIGLIFLILLTCVYKAYKITFQRLTLYHVLITLLYECTVALQIEINFETPRRICVAVSYLYLYYLHSLYVYTMVVTNFSFMITLYLLKTSNSRIWNGHKLSEFICLVTAIVLPVTYIWIPIQDQSFQDLSCYNNNTVRWHKDAIILDVIILVMCVEVVIVCGIFSGLFCYLRCQLRSRKLSTVAT